MLLKKTIELPRVLRKDFNVLFPNNESTIQNKNVLAISYAFPLENHTIIQVQCPVVNSNRSGGKIKAMFNKVWNIKKISKFIFSLLVSLLSFTFYIFTRSLMFLTIALRVILPSTLSDLNGDSKKRQYCRLLRHQYIKCLLKFSVTFRLITIWDNVQKVVVP